MVKDNILSGSAFLCRCIILKNAVFIGVDDFCSFIFVIAVKIAAVVLMYMSVDEIAGLVTVQQVAESLKTPVGKIFAIVNVPGRRMGQQDIDTAMAKERERSLFGPAVHFLLFILVLSVIVIHGAAKSQNADTLMNVELVIHADAAFRWFTFILRVVVAVHIQYRRMGHGDQEGKILRPEISGGQDQVDVREFLFFVVIPEIGRLDVRYC